MKKIFSIAFAATLLAVGCQKTEVIRPDNAQNGITMTFSTEMKKLTKTGETTDPSVPGTGGTTEPETPSLPNPNATGIQNLQAQGFNIWAYADYDISTSTNVNKNNGIFDGMENWYVDYTASGWSPNKQFYWPGKGKKLHFFAVSGSSKVGASSENLAPSAYSVNITPVFENNNINPDAEEAMMTISNYNINTNADDDLMVADFLTQDQESKETTNGTAGKVALNFRHTLSKVQFVFKTIATENAPNVYVQKLTVTNLKDKGTLVVKAKDDTPSAVANENIPIETVVAPKWQGQLGTRSFVVESSDEVEFDDDDTVIDYVMKPASGTTPATKEYDSACGDLLDANEEDNPLVTWLMMPQTLETASNIEVFYLINNRQFKAIFPLVDANNTNGVSSWGENKYTKYTITLSPNLISFDAGVQNDWDPANEIVHQN